MTFFRSSILVFRFQACSRRDIQFFSLAGSKEGPARCPIIGTVIAVFLMGAFGIEVTVNLFSHVTHPLWYAIEYTLEESFEMFGVIFLIKGFAAQYTYRRSPESA